MATEKKRQPATARTTVKMESTEGPLAKIGVLVAVIGSLCGAVGSWAVSGRRIDDLETGRVEDKKALMDNSIAHEKAFSENQKQQQKADENLAAQQEKVRDSEHKKLEDQIQEQGKQIQDVRISHGSDLAVLKSQIASVEGSIKNIDSKLDEVMKILREQDARH